jgi:hypothetical protein
VKSLARERDQAEIRARLKRLRPDSERRFGSMSAQQMVCHLADNFRMALGQKAATAPSGPLQRTLIKWLALYAPLRWPPGNSTSRELSQERGGGGTPPGDFASDLARAEALFDDVVSPARRLTREPHPFFGPLSDAQWLRWAYLHTDHHLRQFGV